MVDKKIGFLLSSETNEIDPESTMGEFGGETEDDSCSPSPTPTKHKLHKQKRLKKEELVGSAIMACAEAMTRGMDKLAENVCTMGSYLKTDPALVESKKWKQIGFLEKKIEEIEKMGYNNLSERNRVKLTRLQSLLDIKEEELFGK